MDARETISQGRRIGNGMSAAMRGEPVRRERSGEAEGPWGPEAGKGGVVVIAIAVAAVILAVALKPAG